LALTKTKSSISGNPNPRGGADRRGTFWLVKLWRRWS